MYHYSWNLSILPEVHHYLIKHKETRNKAPLFLHLPIYWWQMITIIIPSYCTIVSPDTCMLCYSQCLSRYLSQVTSYLGAQWFSGRALDSRPKGRVFEPHRRHCVVSLSKNINPSLVLVQPRWTCPYITERLLMGCKESNQTNKN